MLSKESPFSWALRALEAAEEADRNSQEIEKVHEIGKELNAKALGALRKFPHEQTVTYMKGSAIPGVIGARLESGVGRESVRATVTEGKKRFEVWIANEMACKNRLPIGEHSLAILGQLVGSDNERLLYELTPYSGVINSQNELASVEEIEGVSQLITMIEHQAEKALLDYEQDLIAEVIDLLAKRGETNSLGVATQESKPLYKKLSSYWIQSSKRGKRIKIMARNPRLPGIKEVQKGWLWGKIENSRIMVNDLRDKVIRRADYELLKYLEGILKQIKQVYNSKKAPAGLFLTGAKG